ncbi:MAG: glycosyltransferase [Paraglaciecola sp.]|uniref:glycosyltransferase n=1 Tax=Paraglaciecola sp. TaxID=1920173 RepID=UPI003299DEEC
MELFIIRDGAFTLNKGKPASNLLHYDSFGKRYLDIFQRVYIVGRLFEREDPTAKAVTGNGVEFIPLPGKRGILGLISMFWTLLIFSLKNAKKGRAYILRVPGTIPSVFFWILLLKRIPFAVEVAADPYDSYSSKALDGHFLSPLVQRFFVWLVKLQCKYAESSVYVTNYSLQQRYPPGNMQTSYGFTSLDLQEEAYAQNPKSLSDFNMNTPHIVLTGNMQGSMKGHDVLIRALAKIRKVGINAQLTIIGFGDNTDYFKEMCKTEGLSSFVTFAGKLSSGEPVRAILRQADLFVLPSRQEGLPRALLEAMSLGLPAIGTRVGGVPELISPSAIVEPDSVEQLANKIIEFLSSSELLVAYSVENLSKARSYSACKISEKRNAFLNCLKKVSNS